jgi:hypothetical protein
VTDASTMLPPRQHLTQVVRSLGHHLAVELAGLLQHPRFADGAHALARLADDTHLGTAVTALADDEAAWLADVLLARWSALGEPVLDPAAAIVAPSEVWLGAEAVRIAVEVVVVGAEPGWDAVWDGASTASGARAVLVAAPGASTCACRVHVRARTAAGRVALTASARIAIRRPAVTVRDDRRRIVVADQLGAPAVGVALHIGEAEHVTGPGGLVELAQPAPRGAALRVQGIAAGRIPDEA